MTMLHDVAARGISNSVEARTVIALFLRREGKYREAIGVVKTLEAQYPRDYLFALEEANLRKDAGEGMAAVDAYRTVVSNAEKPGYYASARLELTFFGLGDALRGQRQFSEAAQSYERAAYAENVGPELKIRSLVAAGQCRDLNHERDLAKRDYRMAIDAGPSTSRADAARKYLRTPYTGL
jgi:tetratricopeptide (TPR) repeat protein